MTRLWALLALQLAFSMGCFITNCPQGGKRSSPALASDGLQLPSGTAPFMPLDAPFMPLDAPFMPLDAPLRQPDQLQRHPAQQTDRRLLMALQPRYMAGRGAQEPRGACFIEGICSYPDCCGFEECADSTECRVLRRGYRILVKYIFSKLENAGPSMLDEGTVA